MVLDIKYNVYFGLGLGPLCDLLSDLVHFKALPSDFWLVSLEAKEVMTFGENKIFVWQFLAKPKSEINDSSSLHLEEQITGSSISTIDGPFSDKINDIMEDEKK